MKKTSLTYMWQSVNRRVYQQISNKDVDISVETLLHATTKRTSDTVEISEVYLLISTHET